jgi:hypothetical protein
LLNFLSVFRAIALGLGALLLLRPERKFILFGLAWFVVTALPALPLLNHFLPYYLFLPIVGVSLFIGFEFTWAADKLSHLHWIAPVLMIGILWRAACSV